MTIGESACQSVAISMSEEKKIAVLGAGISGLATGYFLKKECPGVELRIFEKEDRVGGLIETVMHDGRIFEMGARGMRPGGKGRSTLDFVREIGLGEQMVLANKEAKVRFLLMDGRLRKVPVTPLTAVFSPVTRGIFTAIYKDIRIKPGSPRSEDESIEEFSRRHFGKVITRNLIEPIVAGIWGGDIGKLSAGATLPILVEMEKKHGSMLKALFKRRHTSVSPQDERTIEAGLYTFKKGMAQLAEQLAGHLGDQLHLSSNIIRIERGKERYNLIFEDGVYEADTVISTLPAYILAGLVRDSIPGLNVLLNEVEYVSMAVVQLAYARRVNPCKGFGYLVAGKEQEDLLGVLWNSETFPELNGGSGSTFTVFMGGARHKNFDRFDKSQFISHAVEKLKSHLHIQDDPVFQACKIIPKAIPQYNLGHLNRINSIRGRSPRGFHISGNFIGGIAVSDIIRNAEDLSKRVIGL